MSGTRQALSGRRALAGLALACLVGALVSIVFFTITDPATLLIATVGLVLAAACAGYALMHQGVKRHLGVVASVAFVTVMVISIRAVDSKNHSFFLRLFVILAFSAGFVALARLALRKTDKARNVFVRQHRPERPVLILNPKSGGGKVVSFGLVEEARRRGVETILLEPGSDLKELAEAAVRGGADCLGMAGGDGSQALVAEVAIAAGLPFVVIPAGTRNHLALDLGLDRGDPRKAFDAFTRGYLTRIDHGLVAGKLFVNNVAMGAYAEIVHDDAYRDAKLATTTSLLPELMAAEGTPADLHFSDPDGHSYASADILLVGNNPYQMRSLAGFGQRPHLDTGELGITVVNVESGKSIAAIVALAATGNPHLHSGFHQWTAADFTVTSSTRIAAGVDGEAMEFESPLRFEIRPAGLQLLLPPGVRPGKVLPTSTVKSLLELVAGAELPDPSGAGPATSPGATG